MKIQKRICDLVQGTRQTYGGVKQTYNGIQRTYNGIKRIGRAIHG